MDRNIAAQIAELLNQRNQLVREYTAENILQDSENYIYEHDDNVLIACVEVKKNPMVPMGNTSFVC